MSTEEPDRRATPDGGLDAAGDAGLSAGEADGGAPVRRARRRVGKLLLLAIPLLLLALIGWNRAAHSDSLCTSCHVTQDAAVSASRSIHQDVSCLACHQGPGLLGSIAYVPTLLRESIHTVTGWGAGGVLGARDCTECHEQLSPAAHQDRRGDCIGCHGDPSHPTMGLAGAQAMLTDDERHPAGFIQTHGRFVEQAPGTCSDCHQSKFCQACHIRSIFPHEDGWIEEHGPEQQENENACSLCHGPSFCAGCHGTEIPHRDDWLGQHDTALRDASTTPCLTCHPQTDCTVCHSEHNVHVEQDLYYGPPLAQPTPTVSVTPAGGP